MLEADLLKDIRNGISDRRSRCQGKVNDTKRNVQPLGSLLCNELADTRYLKCGLLDRLAEYLKVLAAYFFQSMFDNTRAGNADIDDGIRLGYAVESACHERVVVRCIAENNEFCASKAVVLFACLRRLLDDLTHQFDSIHVDTGFGGAKVDGAADKIRNSQCLRDRTDQKLICCRHTFAYQSGIAAEEIDADFFCRTVQSLCNRHEILRRSAGCCAD